MSHGVRLVLVVSVMGLLAGCGPTEVVSEIDSGAVVTSTDAGSDAGVIDAGQSDGGGGHDAGASVDAGASFDAGGADAGALEDAGSIVQRPADAGAHDAGGLVDAGVLDSGRLVDAGLLDAGAPDAGPPLRRVVVCLTGAVDQNSGSNADFSQLCDQLASQFTVVRSCSGATCFSSFATFPSTSAGTAVTNATFAALDTNQDQRVNEADGPTSLTIVGFSWGGVNGGDLASRLSSDSRIDQASLGLRLVLLDAYQAFVSGVSVASNVDDAWSFRHTVVPQGDCSSGAPLGPYRGVRLRCAAGRPCFDHDFSAAPTTLFGGLPGSAIGHCEVPRAASSYVFQLVQSGAITSAPPTIPVTP